MKRQRWGKTRGRAIQLLLLSSRLARTTRGRDTSVISIGTGSSLWNSEGDGNRVGKLEGGRIDIPVIFFSCPSPLIVSSSGSGYYSGESDGFMPL